MKVHDTSIGILFFEFFCPDIFGLGRIFVVRRWGLSFNLYKHFSFIFLKIRVIKDFELSLPFVFLVELISVELAYERIQVGIFKVFR